MTDFSSDSQPCALGAHDPRRACGIDACRLMSARAACEAIAIIAVTALAIRMACFSGNGEQAVKEELDRKMASKARPLRIPGGLPLLRRGHDALIVGANVEPADVVAHDEDDVGPLLLLRNRGNASHCNGHKRCQHSEPHSSGAHAIPPVTKTGCVPYSARGVSSPPALSRYRDASDIVLKGIYSVWLPAFCARTAPASARQQSGRRRDLQRREPCRSLLIASEVGRGDAQRQRPKFSAQMSMGDRARIVAIPRASLHAGRLFEPRLFALLRAKARDVPLPS